jgi:hypothetical protein
MVHVLELQRLPSTPLTAIDTFLISSTSGVCPPGSPVADTPFE